MAYAKPTDLDGFITQMNKCDIRSKAQLAEDLVNYLSDDENTLYCADLGLLIDALIPFLTGSHFKVSNIVELYRESIICVDL
jgi:CLIP-associating protein 1/2